jgi:archaellum component FlaC
MWKTVSDWLFAVLNMARELQEHREAIRRLEEQTRNIEEAIKLLAQEQRYSRELDSAEREKLLLRLHTEVAKLKELPAPRRKRSK